MQEPLIDEIRTRAAHDGEAEWVVFLRHGNGGRSEVTLDEHAATALLGACGTSDPDALIGQSWHMVRDALDAAWNRLGKPSSTRNRPDHP
jgi:hypothetical protein